MSDSDGAVRGTPRAILRIEGAVALIAAIVVYQHVGGSWLLFAVLLLAPDLFMVGYLRGPRLGAIVYNSAHSYATPAALAAVGLGLDSPRTAQIALIWIAHIGLDRLLGYGLKYGTAFGDTHLGRLGNRPRQ